MTINLNEEYEFYRVDKPFLIVEKFDALDDDFFDFVSIKQVTKDQLLKTFDGDIERIPKIEDAPFLDEWNVSDGKIPLTISPRDFLYSLEKYLEFSFERVSEEFLDIDEEVYNKLQKKIINDFIKSVKK